MRFTMVLFIILTGLMITVSANDGISKPIDDDTMRGEIASINAGECQGLERYVKSLADIGLSGKQLHGSLQCLWGDFDGNGFIDVAVWGAVTEKRGHAGTRKFKVLFFEEGRIIKSQIIENAYYDTLQLYPKTRTRAESGKSLITKLDGLVQRGEEGPAYIYLYDRKSGKLQRHELPGERL